MLQDPPIVADIVRSQAFPGFPRGRKRRPSRRRALIATATTIVLATFGVLVPASPAAAAAHPNAIIPSASPSELATAADLRWQPVLDFDGDGCFNVAAIGRGGEIAEGLEHNYTGLGEHCRDEEDLDDTNAYARQRCNSGWCVYIYAYYFEKDVAVANVANDGHRHDWEHIAVWVKDGDARPSWVAASAHGKFDILPADRVIWEDATHPRIVYHKDGPLTHAFRFAADHDDDPENPNDAWKKAPLISYHGFPDFGGVTEGLRQRLFAHDFGTATLAIKDDNFAGTIENAMPQKFVCVGPPADCAGIYLPEFTFDYDRDENSPGTPPKPPATDPPPTPASPLKVMVVGDSMTQGAEGDWTWRYRLWEWFRDQNVRVDFVGPYQGTVATPVLSPPEPPPVQGTEAGGKATSTSGPYDRGVSREFDRDHFALWGRQAHQASDEIRNQVASYKPDLLLVGLGFNDMAWSDTGPAGTLASMKRLVDEARIGNPDLKFAVANVPQRTSIDGRDDLPVNTDVYNQRLAQAIPGWSTDRSPVKLVDWRRNYDCEKLTCPAGYDGLHPNALGEYQIARAFELTLHNDYKYGSSVPAIPTAIPSRHTPVPQNVVAAPDPQGVKVTWNAVDGARGYTVRSRIRNAGQWDETRAPTNGHYTTWTVDGLTWEYQVRTDNGDQQESDWSPVTSAVSRPQTAPGPAGIVTRATATGVEVAWGVAPGPYAGSIHRYQVLVHDQDTPGAWVHGPTVTGRSARVDGLTPGHRYIVAVASWNAVGGGLPALGRPVVIGRATPPAPTGLRVVSTSPTTVQLNWDASSAAAGYRVWVRNINDGSQSHADEHVVMGTGHGVAYLVPGVWNYEFCVTAVNGVLESGRSNCVVAPRPTGS